MVMCEVFSGASPFRNVDCENEEESKTLAIEICNGKRPEIQDLPPLIAELIKTCWDADPARRPFAKDLFDDQILYSRELLPNSMPSENTNMEKKTDQLNHLYYEIDVARKKGGQANWKAIQSYFLFKEALEIHLTLLL
ncbi:18847_t:CDS:2 [Acaulospora morrowiae]|uniref:18847_t:CDS:1 n=1 Tax=Acaulospora morrowiae TaxID=94023 RepID=A0A9N9BKN1_9GLOM|nr:18847_t:CDS:2 [Acaulospora morrowiae]